MNTTLKLLPVLLIVISLITFIHPPIDWLINVLGRLTVVSWLAYQLSSLIAKKLIVPRLPRVDGHGKAVLITGCDTGFGHLAALYLNDRKFTVFAGCLDRNSSGAKKLLNAGIQVLQLNVTKDDEIDESFRTVKFDLAERNLTLWAIVNNAGILRLGEIEWSTFEHNFGSTFDVNTFGQVRVTRKFIPLLRTQNSPGHRRSNGRVVNVNSVASRFSLPGLVPYCMSKHASMAFTDGLRREMAKFDIKVISVEPFIYSTEMSTIKNAERQQQFIWDSSDQQVKDQYGLRYHKRLLKGQIAGLWTSNGDPMEVVNAIYNGITLQEPNYRYTCCNPIVRVLLWIGQLVPYEIYEHFNRVMLKVLKRNRPCPELVD